MGRSSNWNSNCPSATARRTRTASRVTSGPMPSPGSTAILYVVMIFAYRDPIFAPGFLVPIPHLPKAGRSGAPMRLSLSFGGSLLRLRNRGHLPPALLLGPELAPELHIVEHAHRCIH